MVCINHTEKEAEGACVYCGKLFCNDCLVDVNGKNYCKNCVGKAFDENKNNAGTPNINIVNTNSNVNTNNNSLGGGALAISPKSKIVTLLLCIFLGYIGVHRFYAGKIGTGLLYFFTLGLFGIGVFVDFIMILTGSFRDSYGMMIKK